MNLGEKKCFSVGCNIREVINCNSLDKENFTYIFKIDLPDELLIDGSENIFRKIIRDLIINARKTYSCELIIKIILITCKIENDKEFSVSATSGGKGLSFLETKAIKNNIFLLRDRNEELEIHKINKIIKKEFSGHIKIISKKNKGRTIKCFFPLNQ